MKTRRKSNNKLQQWHLLLLLLIVLSPTANPAERSLSPIALGTPAKENSTEPHLAKSPNGTVVLSWVSRGFGEAALHYAILADQEWQEAIPVASGSDWFLNYADFPSVVPISDELWAAHWLVRKPGGSYSYDVQLSVSVDGGKNWGKPITPHRDDTPTEHGFVSLFALPDSLGVLWLDGRNMESGESASVYKDNDIGGMTLRAAQITVDSAIASEYLVDALVCDCCQTDVAIGPAGPIAVYRDRSLQEIRDIYVSRLVDGQWSEGIPVGNDGWEIDGCPVNGPAIATAGQDVAVAWFTRANNAPMVRLARSEDGAKTFSEAINIDTDNPAGRVDVVLLESGEAVVSWMRTTETRGEQLVMRVVPDSGQPGPVQVITAGEAKKPSGFPKMLTQGNRLIFAWTDISTGEPRVQTAAMEFN